jgi:uncharacterized protein (TIGR02246 family)
MMTWTHKLVAVTGAAAFALAIGGCQKTAGAGASAGSFSDAIKADEKKWNDQFKSKDLEGLMGHYADDAFFVAPGVPSADGSTAIRKAYAEALTDNYFTISFASDKIDGSGDLAYARGHFSEKYQDPKSKQIVAHSGSYITVYKKQQDGSWKAVEDIAVADPATEKMTAPTAATAAKKINLM